MPIIALIAIDPGPTQSGYVILTPSTSTPGFHIEQANTVHNGELLALIGDEPTKQDFACAIEKPECYGMPVGKDVLETVYWIGRFAQAFGADKVDRIPRMAVKMHLCHDSRARDSNVRQALLDRFGPQGTKRSPGLLYGIHGHLWAALALAVTWWDQHSVRLT